MKSKLGKIGKIKKLKYAGYKMILKKAVKSILKKEADRHLNFMLIDGSHVPWADGSGGDKPFLYIGDIKAWKTDIKSMELDMKSYAYGQCQLEEKGDNIQVNIVSKKGKFTSPANLKPTAKIFATKFKPKLFLELVDSLKGADAAEATSEVSRDDKKGDNQLEDIGDQIISAWEQLKQEYKKNTVQEIAAKIKEWSAIYNNTDPTEKKEKKTLVQKIQSTHADVKKMIVIDKEIDKEMKPLYKNIDEHNKMLELGNAEAEQKKKDLFKTFERLELKANNLKDLGLIDILQKYRAEIK